MAKLVGRFLRAYPGYTAERVLEEKVTRFWALYLAIPSLEAADDLRALHVVGHGANVGQRGEAFARLAKQLQAQASGQSSEQARQVTTRAIIPGITPGVKVATGNLRAERLAKRAAFEARKREQGDGDG